MTKPLLHIFVLTYNRQAALRRTLEGLAASPLKSRPITIMDNCSNDGTAGVCEEFLPLLPGMEVRRHERNIGFGANYLRCMEWSRGEYTWILCDDDTLFPDRVGTLLEVLETAAPAACFVGGPRQEDWPGGMDIRPAEIQRRFHTFLTGQSFVPALVFKTSLVTSSELVEAYFGIRTNFPQLVIGRMLLLRDIPCAVLQPPLLQREQGNEKSATPLDPVDGWSAFCRSLPETWKRDAFYSIFARPDVAGMIKETVRMVIWTKIDRRTDAAYHLARISLNMGPGVRLGLIPARLACLVPGAVFNAVRQAYRKVKYGWLRKPLPPTFHLPIGRDELRR